MSLDGEPTTNGPTYRIDRPLQTARLLPPNYVPRELNSVPTVPAKDQRPVASNADRREQAAISHVAFVEAKIKPAPVVKPPCLSQQIASLLQSHPAGLTWEQIRRDPRITQADWDTVKFPCSSLLSGFRKKRLVESRPSPDGSWVKLYVWVGA
jgi:hypothetical protein